MRAARTELERARPARASPLYARDADAATLARLERHAAAIARPARDRSREVGEAPAGGSVAGAVIDEATFVLPLEGVIDHCRREARVSTKAAEGRQKERDTLAGRPG